MANDLEARAGAAVAKQKDEPTLAQLVETLKPEIAKALPAHLSADRLARMALTNPQSFLGALMTCSQLGLEPGPLGEAYFVPFKGEVTFIPGYRGLIKLAWQSGQLSSIAAHVVHKNDEFDFAYGLEPKLVHKPTLDEEHGPVVCVYAAATFKAGGNAFVVMGKGDIERIRRSSASPNRGPWVDHYEAMACKTAIKQLIRYLPLATEKAAPLQLAASLDGSVRRDVGNPVDEAPVKYIDGHAVDTTTGEVVNPNTPVDAELVDTPPAGGEEQLPEGWR
jgi:recombination protein RecT